jgi:cell division protein FtsN
VPTTVEKVESKLYRVQVGAYAKKENAEAMQNKLKAAGFDAVIV